MQESTWEMVQQKKHQEEQHQIAEKVRRAPFSLFFTIIDTFHAIILNVCTLP